MSMNDRFHNKPLFTLTIKMKVVHSIFNPLVAVLVVQILQAYYTVALLLEMFTEKKQEMTWIFWIVGHNLWSIPSHTTLIYFFWLLKVILFPPVLLQVLMDVFCGEGTCQKNMGHVGLVVLLCWSWSVGILVLCWHVDLGVLACWFGFVVMLTCWSWCVGIWVPVCWHAGPCVLAPSTLKALVASSCHISILQTIFTISFWSS